MRRFCVIWLVLLLLPLGALAEITPLPIDFTPGYKVNATFDSNNPVYEDPSISCEYIRIGNQESKYNCHIGMIHVKIADPSQLRTAAMNTFERVNRGKVAVMAKRNNAVVAFSSDFYGFQKNAFQVRQGITYRNSADGTLDLLLIDENADFHIVLADDVAAAGDLTTYEGKQIINSFTFGPALIINNESVLNEAHAPEVSAPEGRGQRLCFAQVGPLEYLVVHCKDVGMSAAEMTEFLLSLDYDIQAAYLLDGGMSAQLVFLNSLVNKESRNARDVPDIIYFASAWQED